MQIESITLDSLADLYKEWSYEDKNKEINVSLDEKIVKLDFSCCEQSGTRRNGSVYQYS